MPRTCTICSHPERAQIDAAFVSGTPYRSIAKQFGCSDAAMYRHTSEHIAQAIKETKQAQEEAQALDVVKQLKEINRVTLEIMKESRSDKKNGMALFAIDRLQKQLELQAKLLGDIDDSPKVTIWMAPEWQNIRALIVQALIPYPDAKLAVATALAQMEDSRARLN